MTVVVNIHRTKDYDVYIGRAGHGLSGYYGNPCRSDGSECAVCGSEHTTRDQAVNCFERNYFQRRIRIDPEYRRRVLDELTGKRLGCFCAPKRCHGDVYVAFCNAGGVYAPFVRSDVAALAQIRASRAANASWRLPKGAVYVSGTERFVVHRINARHVVLRNLRHGGGYIDTESTGPLDPARWVIE